MPQGLREYKYIDGVRKEVYYWVRNLYGRHDAGHIYRTSRGTVSGSATKGLCRA